MLRPLLATALLLLWCAPAARAEVITTGFGNGADSYVQRGGPEATTNFGTNEHITIKSGGTSATSSTDRKGYLRFDLSGLQGPILDAALQLTVSTNNGGSTNTTLQSFTVNVYGLNDGTTGNVTELGEGWGESAINWNNAPAFNNDPRFAAVGPGTANGGQATLLGQLVVPLSPVGAVLTFTSPALVNFLRNDTNDLLTIILTRPGFTSGGGSPTPSAGSANLAFASDEHSTLGAPALIVTTPEPSSLVLLGVVALVGGCYRRSKR